jgi:oligopeptide/dipeptide ABC transporter ATP-binding protein
VSAILEVEDLRVDLAVRSGNRTVVDGLSLSVARSEIFGLVGESGCGKSVTAQTLTRLLPNARIVRGAIRIEGVDVAKASEAAMEKLRGGTVGHVFQEPGSALTPWMQVGRQIREVLDLHRPVDDPEGEVVRLLEEVGVRDPALRAHDYPHQLSGGMQQRVLIAMAVAARPGLLVADEPTTALDVTLQAQVLELFRRLRDRTGTAVLLISHNLAVVARHADRIGVMYSGELVETGPAQAVLSDPRHPYTRGLVAAIPTLPPLGRPLPTIPGQVASIDPEAPGCRFAPRCPIVVPACHAGHPAMSGKDSLRQVRCPRVPLD